MSDEHSLEAAFLYNFTLFTEWPDGPVGVKICVLGQDPFGKELDRYSGREAPAGQISVSRVESARAARGCQVLFIASSEHARTKQIHDELGETPTLTVTEAGGPDRQAVMIVLVPAGKRVEFEVNLTAARQAGLKLSPQLLRLAKRVY